MLKGVNQRQTAIVYTALAEAYRASGNLNEALESLKKAENILINTNYFTELAQVYNRVAAVQFQFANSPYTKDTLADLKSSLISSQKSINELEKQMSLGILVDNYITIGAAYRDLSDSINAMKYFLLAENIIKANHDSNFTIYSYPALLVNMAFLFLNRKDYNKALNYAHLLAVFNENNHIKVTNGFHYRLLSNLYEKKQDYKKALYYKEKEYEFYVNKSYEIKNRTLLELETKYNNQQIEKELNKNKLIKNYQFGVIVGIIIFVLISFGLFISRHNALKKKTRTY